MAGITSAIASATAPVLGNPIPPTPTPSVLESRQEASIPDWEQRIWIVSGEDEGEARETEVGANGRSPLLPHSPPDSCWLRQAGRAGEAGKMAALPVQGEEGDSSLSEQSCLPIPQKISTSAADLVLGELDPPPSPLAVEELTETDPTPPASAEPSP